MEGDRSRHGTTREAPDSQMEDVMRSYHTVIVGAEQMMHLWVRYGIVRYDSRHVLYRRPQMKHANPNRIALRPASFGSFSFFPHPPSVTTANGLRVGPMCGPEGARAPPARAVAEKRHSGSARGGAISASEPPEFYIRHIRRWQTDRPSK